MLQDDHGMVKRCRACQEHANINHQPAVSMQPLKSPCAFDQWGMDLVGPFPQATGQRKFLIIAVDYFTKWVEAEPLAKITEKEVIEFLWKNILCRFDIPRTLVSDNGTQFSGKKLKEWLGSAKGAWVEELPSDLWVYRTTPRTSTFTLSYGTEVVAPAEIGELSWRVKHYDPASNA
ncbi:UNVERIFIED_CONTAM: hypothetical protein Slati_1458500 [Sesamum latifolium]|uniref:Integrase catalytic domain-containing protein n=1 Tax=Sesamum latifolium TaxID=2727402 RepID=A0AAW2XA11_9LAMI